MSEVLEFTGVAARARQMLQEAFGPEQPVFAEGLPQTVSVGGEAVGIETWEKLQETEERVLNGRGLMVKVLSPAAGVSAQSGRAVEMEVTQLVLVSDNVARNQAAGGAGIPAIDMVRHVIAALVGRPNPDGGPVFELEENSFDRIDEAAGVLHYVINFRIRVRLR